MSMHNQLSDLKSCGVIVGADQTQAWMLPWWWENYCKHNDFPVTFVDFGLSEEMKKWCQKRGSLLPLSSRIPPFAMAEAVSSDLARKWKEAYQSSYWWEKRKIWFIKPFALASAECPYNLWVDVDCEVLASLRPLFEKIQSSDALLLLKEPQHVQELDWAHGLLQPGEVLYNSGVVGFKKNHSSIQKWADYALKAHAQFIGDENVLSRLIHLGKWEVNVLDPLYNWRMDQGMNPEAKVIHWCGEIYKTLLSIKIAERQNLSTEQS